MLHRLPSYRNPATKARAVVSPMTDVHNGFFIDLFLYRQKTSFKTAVCKGREAVKEFLQANGYSQHLGG